MTISSGSIRDGGSSRFSMGSGGSSRRSRTISGGLTSGGRAARFTSIDVSPRPTSGTGSAATSHAMGATKSTA